MVTVSLRCGRDVTARAEEIVCFRFVIDAILDYGSMEVDISHTFCCQSSQKEKLDCVPRKL